jgi:4-hydroxy-tetrahydrodipicolinate reductase
MNIALLGYGKMGKEIEKIALERGHKIVLKVDESNAATFGLDELRKADAAIEFSTPETAVENINKCFMANVPVVVGTTGWLSRLEEVKQRCTKEGQGLFYASNYSIGVNLFFQLNEHLAKLMNKYPSYNVSMEEIHHVHKLDAPSGTAISLADQVISNIDTLEKWVNNETEQKNTLGIVSKRIDEVPGTHIVTYSSEVDQISISHIAHSRKGFALGAVIAAEWMKGRRGIYGMKELMALA